MTFILANSTILICIGIVIAVLAIGFVLVPYLQKKGWITSSGAKDTADALTIAKAILATVNFGDVDAKNKAMLIFTVAETAVRYVEQTLTYENSDDKKKLAKEVVDEVIKQIGLPVDDSLINLVNIGIESAVNKLPATYGGK